MGDCVLDYRFVLSDGSAVYIIFKGSTIDERHIVRLHESINRMEDAMIEKGILRAHGMDTKPGKLRAS